MILTNLYFTEALLVNSGTRPIKEDDFFEPLTVSTVSAHQISAISPMGSAPTAFKFEFGKVNESYQLKPLKLNPGDSLSPSVSGWAVALRPGSAGRGLEPAVVRAPIGATNPAARHIARSRDRRRGNHGDQMDGWHRRSLLFHRNRVRALS